MVPPPEANQLTPVFDVPVTLAENCCVPPVVIEAVLGLIESAKVAGLEFDAEEPEEAPQPASPMVTTRQTKPDAMRIYRFLVRGPILFEGSKRRTIISPRYQDATTDMPAQVSKVHAD